MSGAIAATTEALEAAVCLHCGDSCDAGAIISSSGTFCCRGCESVYRILSEYGLAAFYACDVAPGTSQKLAETRDKARFAALDDPAVAARLLEFDNGALSRVTFSTPSMHCASCLWLLEQLWRVDPGITRSEADLVRRTVRITFEPGRTTLRAIAERLAALGYEPVLENERAPGRLPPARRTLYLKIGVAGFAFGNVMLFSIPRYANGAPLDGGFQRMFDVLNVAFAVPVLLFSASDYFRTAWQAVRARAMALEVPVALGLAVLFFRSLADIAASRGEGFMDSFTGLVFFLLIGRLFQQTVFDRIAFDRTFRSFFPLSVRVERNGGSAMTPLEQVRAGDVVIVRPHEVVPADAVMLDDDGSIDYAFVTGEAAPVAVRRGEQVRAGGRAQGRALRLRVTREVSHSQLAALWNNPAFEKPKTYWLTDLSARFGAWFTAGALLLAAAGAVMWWPDTAQAAQVATAVLIIACPCALTLAAPITLGTAMGMLGRSGCYLKHAAVALDLSRIDTVAFDKTGTLTAASSGMRPVQQGLTDAEWTMVRRLAAESVHPASRAIADDATAAGEVAGFREHPGQGICGTVDGHELAIGTAAFVGARTGVALPADERIAVAIDGTPRGWIGLTTSARPGLEQAARRLGRAHRLCLLSGDHSREAARWQDIFGDRMWFRQSPDDKLALVRAQQADGRRVLMIGDGLNDAGALAAADVGMAVSDETACIVPACDAVVRGDRLEHLPAFLQYAKRARGVIVLCFLVSLIYNAAGLWLALAGTLTPLATAILMPVSSLTVVGLSAGAMRWHAREVLPL